MDEIEIVRRISELVEDEHALEREHAGAAPSDEEGRRAWGDRGRAGPVLGSPPTAARPPRRGTGSGRRTRTTPGTSSSGTNSDQIGPLVDDGVQLAVGAVEGSDAPLDGGRSKSFVVHVQATPPSA